MIDSAVSLAMLFAGLFLLCGMITGVWKYSQMSQSADGSARPYVDIAHRASFFYSFASLVIAALVSLTPYAPIVRVILTLVPLAYFVLTIVAYIREGFLERTDNMFRAPSLVPRWLMYSLIVGEIGSVAVIVGGFAYAQFLQN